MAYINLYRKYRPQRFCEVRGQDYIVKTLTNSLLTNQISHAYLFCGPRGTGKTSVAKIFANAINCYHRVESFEPCVTCIESMNDSMDIIEMDAASNNSIDNIRDLKEKVILSPINSKYKIYIIDEVHSITKGAFNALLKILEEPPKHVIFILATTDPQKIPATILSRVMRLNFRLMTQQVIIDQLKFIFTNENIQYEEQVPQYIARLSFGGMRDALSIADQSISFGNGIIKTQDLIYAFSIVSNEKLISILNALAKQDQGTLLSILADLYQSGIDHERLIYSLIDVLKDFIIFKTTNNQSLLNILFPEQIPQIKLLIQQAREYLIELFDLLKRIYFIENPFQYLEIVLLDICLREQKFNKTQQNSLNINEESQLTAVENLLQTHTEEVFVHDSVSKTESKTGEFITDHTNITNTRVEFNNIFNQIEKPTTQNKKSQDHYNTMENLFATQELSLNSTTDNIELTQEKQSISTTQLTNETTSTFSMDTTENVDLSQVAEEEFKFTQEIESEQEMKDSKEKELLRSTHNALEYATEETALMDDEENSAMRMNDSINSAQEKDSIMDTRDVNLAEPNNLYRSKTQIENLQEIAIDMSPVYSPMFDVETLARVFFMKNQEQLTNDRSLWSGLHYVLYNDAFDDNMKQEFNENEFELIQKALSKTVLLASNKNYILLTCNDDVALNKIASSLKKIAFHALLENVLGSQRYVYLMNDAQMNELKSYLMKIKQNILPKPTPISIPKPDVINKYNTKKQNELNDYFGEDFMKKYANNN